MEGLPVWCAVDMYDAAKHDLVWKGVASKTLNPRPSQRNVGFVSPAKVPKASGGRGTGEDGASVGKRFWHDAGYGARSRG
jgi:hypothetical protein